MEGSLWVYGHTDLGDFYRGTLTLRQVYARLTNLPHEAPVWRVLEKWDRQAKAEQTERDVLDTLAQFRR